MELRRRLLLAALLPLFFSSHYVAAQSHPVALPSAANAVGSSPSTSILNATSFYTGANGYPAFSANCSVFGARIAGVSSPTGRVAFTDDTANKVLANLSLSAPAFGMIPTSVASIGQVDSFLSAIASGDFNKDGVPDLVIPSNSTGLAILLNNGKGSFGAPLSVNATYAYQVITADLNGDGNLDLIGSSGSGSAISILLGKGDGSFQAETILSVDSNAHLGFVTGLAAGDFNGDGKLDLAVGIDNNTQYNGTLAILFGNGDGTFNAPVIHQIPGNPPNGTVPFPSRLLAGFLNNDAREDLLVLDFENGADPTVLLSNGDGTFQTSALASDSSVAVMSDFNADGFPDIATISNSKLTVFLNNGNAQFTAATYPSSSDGYLATGDFNGDGKADLINTIGSDLGQLYLGNGDGTFQPPSQFPTSFSFASQLVAADFHQDGFYDLATLSDDIPNFEVQLLTNGRSATAYATGLSVAAGSWTSHNITCHYGGDTNYTASISNDLSFLFQQAYAPTFSPTAGTYPTAQTVTIQNTVDQAIINYTTDGSTPTLSSPIYTGPLTVAQTETIKAIASRYDYVTSPASQAVYTIVPTPASFSFSPIRLTFPTTYLNQSSAVQTLTITNTGSIAATVSSYAFSGSGASQFSIAGKTCGTSLAGEASCTLSIAFKPTTAGAASANLIATDSASGSPQAVPLTGTGSSLPNIAFSPASLTFPSTTIGATSASQVLTVKNTSPFNMTVNSYTFGGINAGEFSLLAKTCNTSLVANSDCTLTIAFKPTTAGTASATLIATDSAVGSPQSTALSGIATPQPTLSFSPANLSFPATKAGTASASKVLTVSNTSSSPMIVNSYTFSGTNASEFSLLSKTCTGSLASSSSCTLTIVFRPTISGSASANLVATDNAAGSPQAAPLAGSAP